MRLRTKKVLSLILIISFMCQFQGCIKAPIKKNILSLGIRIELPATLTFSLCESKMFNYNNIPIETVNMTAMNKAQSINFKSFPFSADDYKNHFKSAFDGEDITISYDYKEVKSKSKYIDKIYKSKAVQSDKKYCYVYLISFVNMSGCLILEVSSKTNQDFSEVVESIVPISSNLDNIQLIEQKDIQTKDVSIFGNITIDMPSSFEVKKISSNGVYYINGFGKRGMKYVTISKNEFKKNTELSWHNIHGYEILKKYDENKYLVHDLNNQNLYYMNTYVTEKVDSTGEKYYLKVEEMWKG